MLCTCTIDHGQMLDRYKSPLTLVALPLDPVNFFRLWILLITINYDS